MSHKKDDNIPPLDAGSPNRDNCYPFPSISRREDSLNSAVKATSPTENEAALTSSGEIVSFYTGQQLNDLGDYTVLCIQPESSGIKMVYRNNPHEERYIAVPILCWGITSTGEIVGLVPWVSELLDCKTIAAKFDICWEGYYSSDGDQVFTEPPQLIKDSLQLQQRYLGQHPKKANHNVIQEIFDAVGTHAMLVHPESDSIVLTAVVSWCLLGDGSIQPRVADEDKPYKYPILAGDDCLYNVMDNPGFRCFFQREIAEQIRNRDPETIEAIERLFVD